MAIFNINISVPVERDRWVEESRERISMGRPITVPIHVRLGAIRFPHPDWDDFAIVILSWWAEQVAALVNSGGKHALLQFMDGPHEIHIKPLHTDLWEVLGITRGLKKDKEVFREILEGACVAAEIVRASTELLRFLKEAGLWHTACEKLSTSVRCLRR